MIVETPDCEQHLLSRAKEKTRGLISLIGDLLDLSRIESGSIALETKPIQIEAILESIVDFLKTQSDFNIKIIDISEKDFVENRQDYLSVLDEICGE